MILAGCSVYQFCRGSVAPCSRGAAIQFTTVSSHPVLHSVGAQRDEGMQEQGAKSVGACQHLHMPTAGR